jgi:outer membrane biosynthesis protein TonB
MSENKTFQLALATSFLIHSIFIFAIPRMPFFPTKRALENIQITYYKLAEKPKKKEIIARKIEPAPAAKLPAIKKEEIINPPKPALKKVEKSIPLPESAAVKEIKEKKFEAVVEEEKNDAKRAMYIDYYRAVREKIRQCADANCTTNKRLGEGEIFLSFIVASSGELLQVRVVDGKSINDPLLRGIAINSIRDASPFPPFPQGMSQYQITFNVIISFETH